MQPSDMGNAPESDSNGVDSGPVPVIVHLSGARRGTTQRLKGARLRIGTASDTEIHVAHEPSVAVHHATLNRRGASYELTTENEHAVWVNGRQVESTMLNSGDVIEIGTDGPILRYRLYPPGSRAYKSPQEAFSDCVECARNASDSSVAQAATMLATAPRELATQTSIRFRIAVVMALAAVVVLVIAQWRSVLRLQDRLQERELEIEGLSELLDESTRTISPEELARIGSEINSTVERVEALEARTSAPARIVSEVSRSVVFIQGAFGFIEPRNGKPLRFVQTESTGELVKGPDGNPAVTMAGSGPPVEVMFTGTGFIASADGLLLTNRHVALPWEFDPSAKQVLSAGLDPAMRRLWGFLPGVAEPLDLGLVTASSSADLAILRPDRIFEDRIPLLLSSVEQEVGDEVLVLGYPTGISALLARADHAMIDRLTERGEQLDAWDVTRELAKAGEISPLVSRGIVAQVSRAAVVFDAETTQGGSGGPILDLEGRVVGVTSAILREFGGSNLGVPSAEAQELMIRARAETLLTPSLR